MNVQTAVLVNIAENKVIVEELQIGIVHVEWTDMLLPVEHTVKMICTVINCEVKVQKMVDFRP